MESYSLKQPVKQTEQLNGFWLITLFLSETIPFSDCLGKIFYFKEAPQTPLILFQHAQNNTSNSYQLLAQQALPQAVIETSQKLYSDGNTDAQAIISALDANLPLLILGNNLHMANAFALAKHRISQSSKTITNAILASETAFPFMVKPARYLMDEMPTEAIGVSTLMEDWHIQNRLASQQDLPGCFDGSIDAMFTEWLMGKQHQMQSCGELESWQVVIFSESSIQKKCQQAAQSFDWVKLAGNF